MPDEHVVMLLLLRDLDRVPAREDNVPLIRKLGLGKHQCRVGQTNVDLADDLGRAVRVLGPPDLARDNKTLTSRCDLADCCTVTTGIFTTEIANMMTFDVNGGGVRIVRVLRVRDQNRCEVLASTTFRLAEPWCGAE